MNLFQWITLPTLCLVLVYELANFSRGPGSRLLRFGRCVVWFGAAMSIAYPDITSELAVFVGIHRGADLVFYLTTLSLIGVAFGFYTRYLTLQRQITDLVRHIAILEARHNSGERP